MAWERGAGDSVSQSETFARNDNAAEHVGNTAVVLVMVVLALLLVGATGSAGSHFW